MAIVTSFTASRILELAAEWGGIGAAQVELQAYVAELNAALEENQAILDTLNAETLPQLQATLSENDILIQNLNDTVLVDLQAAQNANAAALDDLNTVVLPDLAASLAANVETTLSRPAVYVQDEAPTNPDVYDRDLLVGDSWFDSNDSNKQYVWNGVEWSTLSVDIPDLSITVQKFKTSSHMIY